MKTIVQRGLLIFLAASLILLPATGCKSSKNIPDESLSTVYPDDDGPLTPYSETLVVKQSKYQNPNVTYINGESKDDNFMRRFYKEKLNVEWQSVWETDPSSYYTKLNLDIASDDLPDIFMVSASQLKA